MLSVWLPLNGDLRNQGLSNITATNNGATVDNNGKIGKCYSFDGNDDFINLGNIGSHFDGSAFSICFWIFSLENKTRAAVFSSYGLSSTSNFFGLELNSSNNNYCNNNLRFDWLGSDTYSPDDFVTYNAWTHICVTYDGVNQIKMYKNGELIQTSTRVLNAIPVGNTYYLGRDSRTGSTAFSGKLNDFRIYDHCLSPRECKQVSTALVVHYPLSGIGGANYLKNSNFTIGTNGLTGYYISASSVAKADGSIKLVSTSNTTGIYSSNFNAITTGDMTTFSAYVKADSNMTIYIGVDGSGISNCLSYEIGTNWKRISISKTKTTSNPNVRIYGNGTFYIKLLKYELGDHATPWLPNSADPEYAALGLNDGIEYDVSGYNYNGTKYGTLTYSSDTPRYNTSAVFNGSSDIRSAKSSFGWFDFKEGTVAAWFKPANTTQTWASVGVQNDGGQGSRSFSICNYSGKAATVVGYNSSWGNQSSDYSMAANVWYHLCATITNGDTVKLYVNGELVQTRTVTNTTGTIASTTQFAVGVDLPGSDERFTGHLSDVRFYTTCLNESDVRELYNTSMSLSNNGVLFGYEFIE